MAARLLVIDNYDSFTYNLVQYLGDLGAELDVVRNDKITVAEVRAKQPHGIVLSPGPGNPDQAGITLSVLRELATVFPILGVCLGHQAIGQAFGGEVVRADRIMHGKTSPVSHRGTGLFAGLPEPFTATRYHSLIVKRDSLPACLEVTAWTEEGEIMGLAHKQHPIVGVQFHPESILTIDGKLILSNFLTMLPKGSAC
jgi:anthranilate synthase/aminodeoxychorismate synthase-like glutamine amidotransferase